MNEKRQTRKLKRIQRKIARISRYHQLKRKILLPFLKLKKPREIVWRDSYGGSYPACPRCGEMVYYQDMCCFCGQRFKDNRMTVGGVLNARES